MCGALRRWQGPPVGRTQLSPAFHPFRRRQRDKTAVAAQGFAGHQFGPVLEAFAVQTQRIAIEEIRQIQHAEAAEYSVPMVRREMNSALSEKRERRHDSSGGYALPQPQGRRDGPTRPRVPYLRGLVAADGHEPATVGRELHAIGFILELNGASLLHGSSPVPQAHAAIATARDDAFAVGCEGGVENPVGMNHGRRGRLSGGRVPNTQGLVGGRRQQILAVRREVGGDAVGALGFVFHGIPQPSLRQIPHRHARSQPGRDKTHSVGMQCNASGQHKPPTRVRMQHLLAERTAGGVQNKNLSACASNDQLTAIRRVGQGDWFGGSDDSVEYRRAAAPVPALHHAGEAGTLTDFDRGAAGHKMLRLRRKGGGMNQTGRWDRGAGRLSGLHVAHRQRRQARDGGDMPAVPAERGRVRARQMGERTNAERRALAVPDAHNPIKLGRSVQIPLCPQGQPIDPVLMDHLSVPKLAIRHGPATAHAIEANGQQRRTVGSEVQFGNRVSMRHRLSDQCPRLHGA